PTCRLVVPVLLELATGEVPVTVYTQDDPAFPPGLDPVDDTDLGVSVVLDIETVPTLLRIRNGREVARTAGWSRDEWEAITGHRDLGADLPKQRPGCGSRTQNAEFLEARAARERAQGLRSRRVTPGASEDVFEAMYGRGWSDGLPLVPPTPERVVG